MSRKLTLQVAFAFSLWFVASQGLGQTFATRDPRAFAAEKQSYLQGTSQSYHRPGPTRSSRAPAPSAPKGVRDYYRDLRPSQSPNRNVIDPRTLCVPGRRALLQR